jgi:hypothetical protein
VGRWVVRQGHGLRQPSEPSGALTPRVGESFAKPSLRSLRSFAAEALAWIWLATGQPEANPAVGVPRDYPIAAQMLSGTNRHPVSVLPDSRPNPVQSLPNPWPIPAPYLPHTCPITGSTLLRACPNSGHHLRKPYLEPAQSLPRACPEPGWAHRVFMCLVRALPFGSRSFRCHHEGIWKAGCKAALQTRGTFRAGKPALQWFSAALG